MQTQTRAPLTLAFLDWSQAGRLSAPLRHALIALAKPSCEPGAYYSRGSTGPIPIVRAAHPNARGSFRGHDPKRVCAYAQHLLTRLGYPCDVPFRRSGITQSPQNEKKEKKKEKNMSATDTVLVSCADRIVWVRVQGKGSSANSTALRDFAKEMIHHGAREFIVDLRNCPAMDSTFMGTLAGIALCLREMGEGSLSVVNPNERNAESLYSLGLEQLCNVRVSTIKKAGQALAIPLKEDRAARAQTMLEAHEALIKTAPENLPKFKDVIQYLEEKLHVSK